MLDRYYRPAMNAWWRNIRREDAPLHGEARGRRNRAGQLGANALVIGQRPRSEDELSRNEPKPVIGQMHARRVPRALARVGDRQRDCGFLKRLEQAGCAPLDHERPFVRRTGQTTAAGDERQRGKQNDEDLVIG